MNKKIVILLLVSFVQLYGSDRQREIDLLHEQIRNLQQENRSIKYKMENFELELATNEINGVRTKEGAEILLLKAQAAMQFGYADANNKRASMENKLMEAQMKLLEAQHQKETQNFWQYIKRPEIIVSALTTSMLVLPMLFKALREMRSAKGAFLSQRELLELQGKKLSNQKVKIEVASAESDLVEKAIKQERAALEIAMTKRKLKATAMLTDLAAQEADGKPLTPAQLAKRKCCMEELEEIKSAKLQDIDLPSQKLLAQTTSPAAQAA